jgi:TetR/AcrR family transcriptional repressor of nem operon
MLNSMKATVEDARRKVLQVGRQLAARKGFSSVGLNEILSSAGIPKGSFYYYFDSKESYGRALIDQYMEDYLAAVDEMLKPGSGTARERLMRYWKRWVETQSGNDCAEKCLVVKLSAEVSDLSAEMRAALLDGTNRVVARLVACLEEGVRDGSLPAELRPQKTAVMLYQMWLGASLLAKLSRSRDALTSALAMTREILAAPRN